VISPRVRVKPLWLGTKGGPSSAGVGREGDPGSHRRQSDPDVVGHAA
jgi:hypothetical protein